MFNHPFFKDRKEAGKKLSEKLTEYKGKNSIILALPRGGVVVGYEISKRLRIPLDIVVVRKIGAPTQPEFGIGAVSENDVQILDEQTIEAFNYSRAEIDEVIKKEKEELKRRIELYRKSKPFPNLKNKTVAFFASGGLDSCTITHWLTQYGVNVVSFTADLGQPDEPDLEAVAQRMLACGAVEAVIVPFRFFICFENQIFPGERRDEHQQC